MPPASANTPPTISAVDAPSLENFSFCGVSGSSVEEVDINLKDMLPGLVPHITNRNLYVAIGILGATVMPHNLYLHSALVQTRHIGHSVAAKRTACRYNLVDSVVALNGAMLVNCAILIMAAAVFFQRHIIVTEIQQAQALLIPLLGTSLAGVLFAVALLCSGQSSTLTGTLAGQVVVEGFLNFRMRPWLRRLITRTMAITPAALTIYFAGEQSTFQLIILSQVILSLQLPFAIIPLIHFTNDRARMGAFANPLWVRILAWITAASSILITIPVVIGAMKRQRSICGISATNTSYSAKRPREV